MLYVIVCIVLGIVLWYLFEYRGYESYYRKDKLGAVGEITLFSLGGTLVGLLMWLVVGMIMGCILPTEYEMASQPIYAMNDGSSSEGAHFLFSGYYDEKFVCRYIVETEKGKHIEQVNADKAYIVEQDVAQPYVERYEEVYTIDWYWWIALPMNNDVYYKFYVPSGTVVTSYNIDLQ